MLKDSIGYRASLAITTLKSRFAKLLSPYGIAPEQFATLKIISEDNEVTQTRIAELLAKNKTTVGRSIDALVQKGLIDRQDIKNDRRANLITLTAKGENVLKLAIPIAQKLGETDPEYKDKLKNIGTSARDFGLVASGMGKWGPFFNIDMSGYHDGLTDCRITSEMFTKMVDFIKENSDLDISKYQVSRIKKIIL